MQGGFRQEKGNIISNIISVGPNGAEEGDIYMTYAFEWPNPEIQVGSAEERQKLEAWLGVVMKALQETIEAIRWLVRDGQLLE